MRTKKKKGLPPYLKLVLTSRAPSNAHRRRITFSSSLLSIQALDFALFQDIPLLSLTVPQLGLFGGNGYVSAGSFEGPFLFCARTENLSLFLSLSLLTESADRGRHRQVPLSVLCPSPHRPPLLSFRSISADPPTGLSIFLCLFSEAGASTVELPAWLEFDIFDLAGSYSMARINLFVSLNAGNPEINKA